MNRFGLSRDLPFLLSIACGLAGAILLLLMGATPNDDAYITFRHSRNLIEHFHFAWNLTGAPEMGSTTPAFAILLAFFGFLFGADTLPQIALYLNALFLLLSGPLFYVTALELTKNRFASVVIALLLCVNSYDIRIHSQGFESALFVLLLFAGFYCVLHERFLIGGLIAGILPLVRPEGIWLSVPFFVMLFVKVRRDGIKKSDWPVPVVYGIFPFLWLLFAVFYYGQLLPQSVIAKRDLFYISPPLPIGDTFLSRISTSLLFLKGIWSILLKPVLLYNGEAGLLMLPDLPYRPGNGFLSGGNSMLFAIFFFYLFFIFRFRREKRLELIFYFSYPVFYLFFMMYSLQVNFWYLPVWNVSVLFLLLAGFYSVFEFLYRLIEPKLPADPIWKRSASFLPVAVFCVIGLLFLFKNVFILNDRSRPWDEERGAVYVPAFKDGDEFERRAGYRDAAKVFETLPPGVVMANEIGVFGFYHDGPIIDLFGLPTREPIEIYRKRKEAGDPDPVNYGAVIEQMAPDYLMGGYVVPMMKRKQESAWLTAHYEHLWTHPEHNIFGEPLMIWKRKGKLHENGE